MLTVSGWAAPGYLSVFNGEICSNSKLSGWGGMRRAELRNSWRSGHAQSRPHCLRRQL